MNRELVIRPEAEAELAEAFDWYEKRLQGLGADFLLAVDSVLDAVVRNPEQYPRIHNITRRALIRRFPYAVLYVVEEARIIVVAVSHTKRDPKPRENRT